MRPGGRPGPPGRATVGGCDNETETPPNLPRRWERLSKYTTRLLRRNGRNRLSVNVRELPADGAFWGYSVHLYASDFLSGSRHKFHSFKN